MAILNFPNSGLVANVTQYTGDNGITYTWDGVKWIVQSAGIVGTISYTDLTNKPTIPTSFDRLVNGAYELVVETDGIISSVAFPERDGGKVYLSGVEVIGAPSDPADTAPTPLILTSQQGNVRIKSNALGPMFEWRFGTDGDLEIPGNIKSNGNINIEINLEDSTLRRWQFGEDGALTFPDGTSQTTAGGSPTSLINGAYQLELVVNGEIPYVNFPAVNGGNVIIQGNQIGVEGSGAASRASLTSAESDVMLSANSAVTPKNWTFGTDGSLTIPGDIKSNGNINIDINLADSTLRRWTFGEDGDTVFPNNVSINYSGGNIQFPRIIADSGKAFSVQAQGTSGSAALSWTVNPDAAGQYAAVAVSRGGGDNLAKVVIQAQSDSGDVGTAKIWKFDETGNITLPNGSVIKDTDYVAVAFGLGAGTISQGFFAVAVGAGAGYNGQGNAAVAIGSDAGVTSQGISAVAVGNLAGENNQGNTAVAIGEQAGRYNQGANAVAIGREAGYTGQAANSIILNATGATLNQTTANTFTVKPVRQGETADAMYYNSSTGEITYADAFSFSVAADDSTQRLVSNNESIKFIGSGGITTASDAEGNITITGSGGGTSIPTVVTTGAVGVDGAAHCKVQFTVTSATTVTAVGVTAIGVSDPSKGTVTLSGSPGTGSFDIVVVTNTTPSDTYILIPFATNASGTGYGAPGLGAGTNPCLVRGTLITMADMSRVAVENITYNDDILVWDFDLGEFASAKPIWIKKTQTAVVSCLLTFSDHSELRIVGESPKAHRIFNKEAGKFTYGSMPETPIGTTTFNDQGEEITLISKEWIVGEVEFYNVMTDYHMNLFANSILTSMRYNNVYPITDMKFVKDDRTLRTADDYPNVEERLYKGFRLAEQTQSVEEIETHIQWLLTLEVERETESV